MEGDEPLKYPAQKASPLVECKDARPTRKLRKIRLGYPEGTNPRALCVHNTRHASPLSQEPWSRDSGKRSFARKRRRVSGVVQNPPEFLAINSTYSVVSSGLLPGARPSADHNWTSQTPPGWSNLGFDLRFAAQGSRGINVQRATSTSSATAVLCIPI